MTDWGAGDYETTAAELAPVARLVVERAAPSADDMVVDVACGTGNAALLAAGRGAHVIGVDGAARLLDVARGRAHADRVDLDARPGDLLDLPVNDSSADLALSVFGVIFAADPAKALSEIARILRTGGRALLTAWVPAGPIHLMLDALGDILSADRRKFRLGHAASGVDSVSCAVSRASQSFILARVKFHANGSAISL